MECSICLDEIEDELNTSSIEVTNSSMRFPNLFKRAFYKKKNKSNYSSNALAILPCGHKFHADCIQSWIKTHQSCPYCRYFLKNKFKVKVILNKRTISRNSVLEINERNPKEINLNIILNNFLGNRKKILKLNRFNIINVYHNNRGMIKLKLYKTLHATEDELKLFIYNKQAREHIYDQFVCVIKSHYISNSDITFSDIDEEEANLNALEYNDNNLPEENTQPVSILSCSSSLSSLSLDQTHTLNEIE